MLPYFSFLPKHYPQKSLGYNIKTETRKTQPSLYEKQTLNCLLPILLLLLHCCSSLWWAAKSSLNEASVTPACYCSGPVVSVQCMSKFQLLAGAMTLRM